MLRLMPGGRLRRWWAERNMKRNARRTAEREGRLLSSIPQVRAEGRDYLLFVGPLSAAAFEFDISYQSPNIPNIWWPDDRAWCVATEIDFSWTYVGASRECIDRILSSGQLDSSEVSLEDPAVDPRFA
jgi:hypothetical protein